MNVTTSSRNVHFGEFTPAMRRILNVLCQLNDTQNYGFVITSANDSTHMEHSRHYANEALDIRTHNLRDPEQVQIELTIQLGSRFTVLLEGRGSPNEHLHIQSARNRKYTLEDLYSTEET